MPAKEIIIQANGLRFHVLDWGEPEKPPLFLLHGLASSARMFDLIAPALAQRFHVYAIDQRGHGLSDKPSEGYDFETIVTDLEGIISELGYGTTAIPVVGHSWGAYSALYYAATRPNRVSKIALIDGGIRPLRDSYPTWAEAAVGLAPPRYVEMSVEDIHQLIRKKWLGNIYRSELEPLALSIYDLSDPADVQPHLNRDNHMKIAYQLWSFQPQDYYVRVRCPTLIINAVGIGETIDEQRLIYARQARDNITEAEIVWMQDTSHDIPWHRPAELNALLDRFL